MAKRFTRNIRSIKDIEKQPKNTNQQNDLLSDDKHVYIRNKDKYENLTNSVKSVNQKTIDEKGNVEVDTGVMQVNGKDPDNKGNVDIDAGSGIKTVTNVAPDENGNVDLQIKDFKEQKKLVRKNQLDEALEGIESGYKNYFSVKAWEEQVNTDVVDNDLPAIKLKLEGNTQYTLSTNIPVYDDSTGNKAVFFATSDVGRVNSGNDGVSVNDPRTITTNEDGEVVVVIREKDMTSGDWWVMLNKGTRAAPWTPAPEDLVDEAKKYTDKKIEDKADKSEITELNNKIGNYYDNLFETKVLYDGMEDNSGIYFDENHSFSIDQNKKVEKVVFWWSRYDIGNGPKNYAFNNTIVDGEMLRILQKKESTMRVPFKPTEADTSSFKNIDFTKEGVNGSEKNTKSDVGDRDNRWMALRKLYVVYRKEV